MKNTAWIKNEIDYFVLVRLEAEGIEPAPEADKRTLIRRLSLDITGLPPSTREVAAFLADRGPGAYERLVERLLQSRHYGEKWGRYWQDLVRYADSDGYTRDRDRPHMWRYREWVVNALNEDMPFDQFTVEQLAGDLVPNSTVEQRIATGFYGCGPMNREAGVDLDEVWFEQVVDRTKTVGDVWLGLTVGCAQCHDHKYDPVSQKDFYQLFAFFNRVEDVEIDAPLPGEIGPYLQRRPQYAKKRQELLDQYCVPQLQADWEENMMRAGENPGRDARWDFLRTQLGVVDFKHKVLQISPERRSSRERDFLTDVFIRQYRLAMDDEQYEPSGFEELQKSLRNLNAEFPGVAQAMAVQESAHPPQTHIAVRGDYKQKGAAVSPNAPAVLPPMPVGENTRLTLARWLVADENPLPARVMVNRVWQELFGCGLVLTSEDLGTQGENRLILNCSRRLPSNSGPTVGA